MSLMLQQQSLFSSHTGHVMGGVISRKHIYSFFLYTDMLFFLCVSHLFYAFAGRATKVFYCVICVTVAGIRWDTSLISTSMDAFMKGASRLFFFTLQCSILLLIFLFSSPQKVN